MSVDDTYVTSPDSSGDSHNFLNVATHEFAPSDSASEAITNRKQHTARCVQTAKDDTEAVVGDEGGVVAKLAPATSGDWQAAHADQLISAVGEARAGLQSERAIDISEHFGDYSDDMSEFIVALGGVTSSGLQALDGCFSEHDTLSHYRDVCADWSGAAG